MCLEQKHKKCGISFFKQTFFLQKQKHENVTLPPPPEGSLVMCLPDFDPAFHYMTSGLRSFGRMLDNWINVASIIAQKSIGFSAPECEQQSAQLSAANASTGLFGSNRTAVVGLTPGLYAVTDGVHIQYFNHYSSVESVLVPNAWPMQVDVSIGLAAVTLHADSPEQDDYGPGEQGTHFSVFSHPFLALFRLWPW